MNAKNELSKPDPSCKCSAHLQLETSINIQCIVRDDIAIEEFNGFGLDVKVSKTFSMKD